MIQRNVHFYTNFLFLFYRKTYYPPDAYNQSKLAQILFTRHLQLVINQDEDWHVQVHAVHPGVVDTDLFQHCSLTYVSWFKKLFFKVHPNDSNSTCCLIFDILFVLFLSYRIQKKDREPLSMQQFHLELKAKVVLTSVIAFVCQ